MKLIKQNLFYKNLTDTPMTKKVRSTAGVAWPGVAEKMWSSELNIKFTVPSHYKHISLEQKDLAKSILPIAAVI